MSTPNLRGGNPREKIIVALDVDKLDEAEKIVKGLGDEIDYFKIGYQLFFREGIKAVKMLADLGKRIFLDLKLGDIGNTMHAGISAFPEEVEMLTIQGDRSVCKAAVDAASERADNFKVLLLTALSSSEEGDPERRKKFIEKQVKLAIECKCKGVIASGDGVAISRKVAEEAENRGGKLDIVVPGIRPAGAETHDQKHILSPGQAILAGADQLVIGRALTQAKDPQAALQAIIEEISTALRELADTQVQESSAGKPAGHASSAPASAFGQAPGPLRAAGPTS